MKDQFSRERVDLVDKKRVHGVYARWPELARSGFKAKVSVPAGGYKKVYVLGMGGSAACGDILAGWLWTKHGVEAQVCKGVIPVPDLTGALAIACSASGMTKETLEMMKTARERNATLVSTSHGGLLAAESKEMGVPHIEMPRIVAPRYMLPFMLFSCLSVLDSALGLHADTEAREAMAEMEKVGREVGIGVPTGRNDAKRLALRLLDKAPAVYGTMATRGAGIRFKNSVSENSKKHASYDEMPELFHNEIQAWEDPSKSFVPVLLRDDAESPRERKLADAFVRILAASGRGPVEVRGKGNSSLSRLMTMVYELEYVSYYLAIGLGRDPITTRLIDRVKRVG